MMARQINRTFRIIIIKEKKNYNLRSCILIFFTGVAEDQCGRLKPIPTRW